MRWDKTPLLLMQQRPALTEEMTKRAPNVIAFMIGAGSLGLLLTLLAQWLSQVIQ